MKKQSPYINRDLSWLDFNARVLEEACDAANPLLERLKFLSIYCSNLDEFFMVRVGALCDKRLASLTGGDAVTNMPPEKQLEAVLAKVSGMTAAYGRAQRSLFPELAHAGVALLDFKAKGAGALRAEYVRSVMPLLSAVIVDAKRPFPYLPCKSVFVAARIKGKKEKLGLIMFPESADKTVFLRGQDLSFFLAEDAALVYAGEMFPRRELIEAGKFRITRSADILPDEDPDEESFKAAMQRILEVRKRLAPVRLETDLDTSSELVKQLCSRLGLEPCQAFHKPGPLDMSFAHSVAEAARLRGYAKHLYPAIKSVYVPGLKHGESVISQVKTRDFLMLHPFVNFEAVLALLREAAHDESVIAIRQTLYRVSSDSEVVKYLLEAAENGKEVTVLVELKARFDEQNNINWAAKLEDAGCRVIYGRDFLKVHSKLLLVTRKASRGFSYTAHISTGNYNEKTASLYTDIGLLTSNEHIARDIMQFFRELGSGAGGEYRALSVSPGGIRKKLCALIDRETSCVTRFGEGRIVMKMNSLADRGMIDKLIAASKAGVKIDLIVRGICCLKAGLSGITENIRVVSVVGRFLEHSRVYWFLNGGLDELFISSADLMTRNLDRRMEVLCPVLDRPTAAVIKDMTFMLLSDTAKGRLMRPDSVYERLKVPGGVNDAQMAQYEKCREDYKRLLPQKSKRRLLRRALGGALVRFGRRIFPG